MICIELLIMEYTQDQKLSITNIGGTFNRTMFNVLELI